MSAFRAGATMAQLNSALGGLGAAPKRGKKRRAPGSASPDLRRVVSAFVAGRPASGSPGFGRDGQPYVRYVTDGIQLYVNGALVAERLVPSGLRPLNSEANKARARAVKQMRVCPNGAQVSQGPLPGQMPSGSTPGVPSLLQTSAPFRPSNVSSATQQREILHAANEIMSLVKAGLSFREVRDFVDGYRTVVSNIRLGAGGSAAVLPGTSSEVSDCVVVEVSEKTREMAMVNYVTDHFSTLLDNYRADANLSVRSGRKATKASKAELVALITQLRMAQQAGDAAAAGRIAVQLQTALQTGRSQVMFPGF